MAAPGAMKFSAGTGNAREGGGPISPFLVSAGILFFFAVTAAHAQVPQRPGGSAGSVRTDGSVPFTGSITLKDQSGVNFCESDDVGSDCIGVRGPASVDAPLTCVLENTTYPWDACVSPFVKGPADSVVDEVPVYDDTTGKRIKRSPCKIDSAGNLMCPGTVSAGATGGREITFEDADGSHGITVQAPATVTANRSCTFEDDNTPFDTCISAQFHKVEATTVTEPVACGASTTGVQAYVDDTDDGAAAQVCTCIAITDSTYDWRRSDDLATACTLI